MFSSKALFALSLALSLVACSAQADKTETTVFKTPSQTASASFPNPASAEASGWTPERFKTWVQSRASDGSPVYWYSVGTLRAFPGGEMLYKLEGYDTARASHVSATKTEQYSRKIYIYRDVETGEVIKEVNGETVEPIAYPYQFITYDYKTDGDAPYLQTFVEQGKAPRVQKIGPGTDITVRQVRNLELYTAPLFLDFPIPGTETRYQTFENYDFVIPQDPNQPGMITFMRYGPLPTWAQKDGITMGAMHMTTWRISNYEDVPESLRSYIEAEAPLWAEPPKDLADIRRLQAPAE